ncbi:Ribonuclease H-like domain [Trinorchestia longiramus]|nr:Ribonuclease H-like domain [Trinorchestia longiramus]
MSQLKHKSSPGRSDHNMLPTASSAEFLMNRARPSSFGLWDDPLDNVHDPEQLLMHNTSMDHVAHLVHTAPPGFQVQPPLQLSLSQLLSLGSSVLGWQVLVQGAEGSFIGYICWLLDHCSRLGLEQASQPESGVRRVGVLLLSYCHVSSVTILARRANQPRPHPAAAKSGVVEERHGRSLLMKKLVNPHLTNMKEQSDGDEDGEDRDGDEGELPPLPPPALWLHRPSSWTVIDALDESYQEAVSAISLEKRVGLSAVGHKLGRWGTLAWLAVATPLTVYLFDAATLGLLPLLLGTSENKEVSGRLRYCHDEGKDPSMDDYKERDLTDVSNGGHLHEPLCSKCSTTADCQGEDLFSSRKCSCDADSNKQTELTCRNGALATDAGSHSLGRNSGSIVLPSTDEDSLDPSSRSQLYEQTSERDRHGNEESQHRCLKEVLQDPHLEVVVHDSRNLQDLLQHQAGFTISALFDTQAAEVYLYITLHEGDCPAFVPSLSCLLQRRLQLAPQHLLYERVQRRLAGDSSAYLERPLDEMTLKGIASSAAFLCELRALQLQDILADLRQLTALHSSSHALKDDLMRSRVEQHVVPAAVQRLGRQTVLNYKDSLGTRRRRRN